jgi:hypothetical protein
MICCLNYDSVFSETKLLSSKWKIILKMQFVDFITKIAFEKICFTLNSPICSKTIFCNIEGH